MSLLQNSVTLLSSDILSLNTNPFTIVSAQGTGTIINPISMVCQYNPSTGAGTYYPQGQITISYGGINPLFYADIIPVQGLIYDDNNNNYTSNQMCLYNTSGPICLSNTNIINQPLQFKGDSFQGSIFDAGSLETASILIGGSGYSVGDTGYVYDLLENAFGTYTITLVDENGGVNGFDTPTGGVGISPDATLSTSVITGSGDGNFQITADSITTTFNGSIDVQTTYMVHNIGDL